MRKLSVWILALAAASVVMTAAADRADAAVRLGADGLWMPLAFQNVEGDDADYDSDHDLGSFGAAGHVNLGFDIFSIGLKVNYFNQSLSFDGNDDRLKELDINLMGRFGIPATDVAIFGEVGPTTNPGFDYWGYDIGGGVEYDLLGMPLVDLNVGVMGQFVHASDVEFSVDIAGVQTKSTAEINEGRGLIYLGVDFSI